MNYTGSKLAHLKRRLKRYLMRWTVQSPIVSNTSPLIHLCRTGLIEILPKLYTPVFVPESVHQEILQGTKHDPITASVFSETWIVRISETPCTTLTFPAFLGEGEKAAIMQASLRGLPVLLDDLAGRKYANQLGLEVIGTLGLVIEAKRLGHLTSAVSAFLLLQHEGKMFFTSALAQKLLSSVGEVWPSSM